METEGIRIPEAEWNHWIRNGGKRNASAEFTSFTASISDALLEYNRLIFHAVSFRYKDRAWLICAESGVGKTTQIKTLINLFPGEFSVICGDRTILELTNKNDVIAHPSPWNGKEGLHGAGPAPLAGILCLERGESTQLIKLSKKQAVFPILNSVISTFGCKETIDRIAIFENELLEKIPVWQYINGGIPDSSRILFESLLKEKI